MPKRVTPEQRQAVLQMLAKGEDRDTISASVGITPGQVSAIAAHVKMGTYDLPPNEPRNEGEPTGLIQEELGTTPNLLRQLQKLQPTPPRNSGLGGILLGTDAETSEEVFWNPDPSNGAANPHVLVRGESGFGKTYTIACLLAELAQQHILSVVFDYGQGFTPKTLANEFVEATSPVELNAGRDGVNINPLQI